MLVKSWLISKYGSSWQCLPPRTMTSWTDDHNNKKAREAERAKARARGEKVQASPPPKKRGPKLWIDDEKDDALLEKLIRRHLLKTQAGVDLEHLCGYVKGLLDSHDRFKKYRYKGSKPFLVSRSWMQDRMEAWDLRYRKGTTAARKLPDDWENVIQLFILRLSHDVNTIAKNRDDCKVSNHPSSFKTCIMIVHAHTLTITHIHIHTYIYRSFPRNWLLTQIKGASMSSYSANINGLTRELRR